MKVCSRCGEAKPLDDFHRHAGRPDGRQPRCKPCQIATVRKPARLIRCPDCGTERQARIAGDGPVRCRSCAARRGMAACGRTLPPGVAAERRQASRERDRQQAQERTAANAAIRRRVFVAGTCRRCGGAFVLTWRSDGGRVQPVYCSERCRHRGKGKGQSRPDITQAQRLAVFERDRWVCGICHKRVSRALRWPHPRCAVVDHIVPLSAGPENGGVHAPHNWRTAHSECNARKAAEYLQGALL